MSGILLGLIPLFAWGTGDYVASRLSKHHPAVVNVAYSIVIFSLVPVVALLFGMPEITLEFAGYHLVAAVLTAAGFMTFVRAFSFGIVGPVSSISNAYAIITAGASAVFLGEALGVTGWLAIAVVVSGIYAVTYEKKTKKKRSTGVPQHIIWAVISMLLFGFGFFMFDVASKQEWHDDFILFQTIMLAVSLSVLAVWLKQDSLRALKAGFQNRIVVPGAFIAGIGTIGFFAAIQVTGSATIPALLSASSPLVTSIWAYYVDKERLSTAKRVGAVTIVAGIMLLSL